MSEHWWQVDFKKIQQSLYDEFASYEGYHILKSPTEPNITKAEKNDRVLNLKRKICYMLFGPCEEVSNIFFYPSRTVISKSTSDKLVKKLLLFTKVSYIPRCKRAQERLSSKKLELEIFFF